MQHGDELIKEKPETREEVKAKIADLEQQWNELENTTKTKGKTLFEANSQQLFTDACDDMEQKIVDLETELCHADAAGDLVSVNNLLKKQQVGTLSYSTFMNVQYKKL